MQLKFVVFASPLPGREDEFHAWYDGVHMRDMLDLPGVRSVERYDLVPEPDRPAAPGSCLALFEFDVEDVPNARAILQRGLADGLIPLHESQDRTKTRSWFFTAVPPA